MDISKKKTPIIQREFTNINSIGLSPGENLLVVAGDSSTAVYPINGVEWYEFSEIKSLIQ